MTLTRTMRTLTLALSVIAAAFYALAFTAEPDAINAAVGCTAGAAWSAVLCLLAWREQL